MTESSTPASDNGAPMRTIVGKVRQSGARTRSRPRRSAITRPNRKPPPRTMTDASAAPATPRRGNGPRPLARGTKRGLEGEEPEYQRSAEQPRGEIGVTESRHFRRNRHKPEHRIGQQLAGDAHHEPGTERVHHRCRGRARRALGVALPMAPRCYGDQPDLDHLAEGRATPDRKSTRLNSSHQIISYAVFCLKKKKQSVQ